MSISTAYNQWSAIYDTNENKTRDLDQLATRTTLERFSFDHVLEMGCGTGKNTEWLATRAQSVTGFDFSQGMLDRAKEKITAPHVTFRQADLIEAWDVEPASADLITFNLVLEHIEDLADIYQKSYDSLQPGGRLFICELHPFKQYAGSKARFETDNGQVEELKVFIHSVSEFVTTGMQAGFTLLELKEWYDEPNDSGLPRLLSLVFEK